MSLLEQAQHKIFWRITPFLLLCYTLAYLDRINIGFAKMAMQQDLALSDAIWGFGAGIFFIGYVLFEIPSNLLLEKIGMRRTISRIMVLWGLTSTAMMFVDEVWSFYFLRFLLGVFEAGFAPAMFYYLMQWFDRRHLTRALAVIGCAGPIGGSLGAPLSMAIMHYFNGWLNLAGWQWLFIIEGLPSICCAFMAWYFITDHIKDAHWLSPIERRLLMIRLAFESQQRRDNQHNNLKYIFCSHIIYRLALGYFCLIASLYVINFWLPTMLVRMGISSLIEIGWYSALPSLLMFVSLCLISRHSDQKRERRWHTTIPLILAFLLLLMTITSELNVIKMNFYESYIILALAAALIYGSYIVFWGIPRELLAPGKASAVGIALINSIGLLGGFISPTIVGLLSQWTVGNASNLMFMAIMVGLSALLIGSVKINDHRY